MRFLLSNKTSKKNTSFCSTKANFSPINLRDTHSWATRSTLMANVARTRMTCSKNNAWTRYPTRFSISRHWGVHPQHTIFVRLWIIRHQERNFVGGISLQPSSIWEQKGMHEFVEQNPPFCPTARLHQDWQSQVTDPGMIKIDVEWKILFAFGLQLATSNLTSNLEQLGWESHISLN